MASYTSMYTKSQKEIKKKMKTIQVSMAKRIESSPSAGFVYSQRSLCVGSCLILSVERQLLLHVLQSEARCIKKGIDFSCFLCVVLIKGNKKERRCVKRKNQNCTFHKSRNAQLTSCFGRSRILECTVKKSGWGGSKRYNKKNWPILQGC